MKNFIIADIGLSRGKWFISKDKQNSDSFFETSGIHPQLHSEEYIKTIVQEIKQYALPDQTYSIYYFGAGCKGTTSKNIIKDSITQTLTTDFVYINSDLFGTCVALSAKENANIGILGTGSNYATFVNNTMVQKYINTGYLFGNEGSGFAIGRTFLKHYFDKTLSKTASQRIEEKTKLKQQELIHKIYSLNHPYPFIASFTKLIDLEEEQEYMIVYKALQTFISNSILPLYNSNTFPIHFNGSIAFHFQDILISLLKKYDIKHRWIVKDFIHFLMEKDKNRLKTFLEYPFKE